MHLPRPQGRRKSVTVGSSPSGLRRRKERQRKKKAHEIREGGSARRGSGGAQEGVSRCRLLRPVAKAGTRHGCRCPQRGGRFKAGGTHGGMRTLPLHLYSVQPHPRLLPCSALRTPPPRQPCPTRKPIPKRPTRSSQGQSLRTHGRCIVTFQGASTPRWLSPVFRVASFSDDAVSYSL